MNSWLGLKAHPKAREQGGQVMGRTGEKGMRSTPPSAPHWETYGTPGNGSHSSSAPVVLSKNPESPVSTLWIHLQAAWGNVKSHPCLQFACPLLFYSKHSRYWFFKQLHFLNTKKKMTFQSFTGHWISHIIFGVEAVTVLKQTKKKRGDRELKDEVLLTARVPRCHSGQGTTVAAWGSARPWQSTVTTGRLGEHWFILRGLSSLASCQGCQSILL